MKSRSHHPRSGLLLSAFMVVALAHSLTSTASTSSSASTPDEPIRIQSFQTHSRISFRLDESVTVEWKATPDGFQAFFKSLGLADFGAVLGEEKRWAEPFAALRDPRLSALRFKEVPGGLLVEGSWRFATGPEAPAEPRMEIFDYRERSPGRYVVDFWVRKGPTVAEVQALQRQRARLAAEQKARQEIRSRVARRVATEKARVELNDLDRYCSEPLRDDKDVFLPFLAVHERVDYSRYISSTTPDSQFPYYEPKEPTKEAQYVRLALDLYRQGKHGLVIRTLDFLEQDFPASRHRHEMRFLRANALIKLNLIDPAEQVLERLRLDAKDSAVALHSAMYLAGRKVERKNPLASHEAFSWLAHHYPEHRLAWLFRMGAAEALYQIRQTERAAKEYQWVVENAPIEDDKAEAAFRMGDLYMERFQYEQALGAYANAVRYFPKQSLGFPSVYLNKAEALYGMGQYDEAQRAFEEYLKRFASFPEGWRATYRLGEIFGRREGAANIQSSRQWFYETINRYPFSPGGTLARMRLMPCGDHAGYNYDAAQRFYSKEARNFDGSGILSMVHYQDFRALAQVRTWVALKRDELAVDLAAEEIQRTKVPHVKRSLRHLFTVLFRRNILALLEQGQKYEALTFFNDRSHFLDREMDGDPDYLLKLSAAASDLGLGKLGEQLAAQHHKAVKSLQSRGLAAEGAVAAKTPAASPEELDQKLKASEKRFTEAKALWISSGLAKENEIRELLGGVVAQSPFSFQKEIILGLLDERREKFSAALKHAIQAQILIPTATSREPAMRIQGWLAALEAREGDPKAALEMYRGLEKQLEKEPGPAAAKSDAAAAKGAPQEASGAHGSPTSDRPENPDTDGAVIGLLGVPAVPTLDTVLLAQGALLEKLGKWGESAATYSRAVDGGLGGNQALYSCARALLRTGKQADRGKAVGLLEVLSASKNEDFWKKLAQETLANINVREKPRRATQ